MSLNKHVNFFNRGSNVFDYAIYSPLVVFHKNHRLLLDWILRDMRTHMLDPGSADAVLEKMIALCLEELNTIETIGCIEKTLEQRLYREVFSQTTIANKVAERAYRISEQIQKGLQLLDIPIQSDFKYMDFGCGSGMVAKLITDSYGLSDTLLIDVIDYTYEEVKRDPNLRFELFTPPYRKIPTANNFDLVTITNVLHHSSEPWQVFETASRYVRPGGYIAVIESCIGTTETYTLDNAKKEKIPYQTVFDPAGRIMPPHQDYLAMGLTNQMIYGIFFDWLYNRAFINEDVNVPYNFGTADDWNARFQKYGYTVKETWLMGIDQPAVLEYHTLHVMQIN
jgi:SAM-dependent methyltransferase